LLDSPGWPATLGPLSAGIIHMYQHA
jgi:hypothetical protein